MGVEKKVHISDDAENAAHALMGLCIPIVGPLICLLSNAFGARLSPDSEDRERLLEEATAGNDDNMFKEFSKNRRPYETGCEISQSIELPDYKSLHGGLLANLGGPIKKTSTYRISDD